MPMWGGSAKGRPTLVINTMEFTRAKLDDNRRKGKLRKRRQEESTPEVQSRADLEEAFNRAIRINLRELGDAYMELSNARKIRPGHIESINRIASELQDLASSADYKMLGRAAASLVRLTQDVGRGAAHPELIKLHLDSLRSMANHAFRGENDETSIQLLNALKLAVDGVMSVGA